MENTYTSGNNHYHDPSSNSLTNTLRNEEKELVKKIEKSREEGNWGTYKNLIIALKEVVGLRYKVSEEDRIVESISVLGLKDTDKLILKIATGKDDRPIVSPAIIDNFCNKLRTSLEIDVVPVFGFDEIIKIEKEVK